MLTRRGHRVNEELIDWDKILAELHEIGELNQCPFQQFALSHGYDLVKDKDRLIFPLAAPTFRDTVKSYGLGTPYVGWVTWLKQIYLLPKNVRIDWVEDRVHEHSEIESMVQLVKFMNIDRLTVPWATITAPWPEGSHSRISYTTVRGKTVT